MKLLDFLKNEKSKTDNFYINQAWFDASCGRGTLTDTQTGVKISLWKVEPDKLELLPGRRYLYQYGSAVRDMVYYEVNFSLEDGILSAEKKLA